MEAENMMQINPYAEMMGNTMPTSVAPEVQPPQYTAIQQPIPPEVQKMHQPTTNPVEIQQRQEGWQEVIKRFTSDPNIMRAVGMFGASLSSARTPGQTHGGHFGQAMTVGRSAYDFGKQSEIEQRMRMTKEQREQAESDARVASSKASTEGQVLTNTRTRATMDDAIAKVKTEREKAEVELASAKTDQERNAIQLAYTKKVEGIKMSIPDAAIRSSFEEEFKAKGLNNKLTEAQINASRASANASNASAGNSAASAARTRLETKAIEDLSPEERTDYILKRGKYGAGAGSAQVQVNEYFRSHWANANPKKDTETDATYKSRQSAAVLKHMQTVRDKGNPEQFMKFIELQPGPPNESLEDSMKRFEKFNEAMAKMGGGGAPAPAAKSEDVSAKATASWGKYEPDKYDYRIGADGIVERKSKTKPITVK